MKNLKYIPSASLILTVVTALVFVNCSVKAPEVNITGEKTALENQVIGTYEQIEEDVWTLTSVRSATPGGQPAVSADKKKVLEAVRGRKFNKDDIDEFLEQELVGESNTGLLEIRNQQELDKDENLKTRVTTIVKNENEYRKIIMDRIILLNVQAAEAGEANVSSIFAKMNQDNAAEGSWIQTEDGQWIKKPPGKK